MGVSVFLPSRPLSHSLHLPDGAVLLAGRRAVRRTGMVHTVASVPVSVLLPWQLWQTSCNVCYVDLLVSAVSITAVLCCRLLSIC